MNASSITGRVKTWLSSTWHVRVPDHWVEACIDWIQQENNGINLSQAQINKLVYEQWLLTDLRDLLYPVLPDGISGAKKSELNGFYSIQIDSLVDVSQPAYSQLQKLRGRNNQNEQVSDTTQISQKPWEAKPTRMLMLQLTDGIQQIEGMEYKSVPVLHNNIAPGTKMSLQGIITCRLGVLLLKPENVKILGGEVEALFEENSQERVLAKLIGEDVPPPSRADDQRPVSAPAAEIELSVGPSDEELLASLDDDTQFLVDYNSASESGYNSRSNITNCNLSHSHLTNNEPYNHQPDRLVSLSDANEEIDSDVDLGQFFQDEHSNEVLGNGNNLDDDLFLEEKIQQELLEAEMRHTPSLNGNGEVSTGRFTDLSISSPLDYHASKRIGQNRTGEGLANIPFTYISVLLAGNENTIRTVQIKGFIVTLLGKLSKANGLWCVKATISDGTAFLNVDFNNDVLTKLIGFSVQEMKTFKNDAQHMERKMSGSLKCQRELVDLCCLMTLKINPSTAEATVIDLKEVNMETLENLKKRLNN